MIEILRSWKRQLDETGRIFLRPRTYATADTVVTIDTGQGKKTLTVRALLADIGGP